MRTALLLIALSASAFGQRHYGGMNNRYYPGALGQTNNHATQDWWANGDDVTFGNVDFTACEWAAPSAFMLTNSGALSKTTATNWDLNYYNAVAPNVWLFSVRNLSPFVNKPPIPTAGTWHMLCGGRDAAGQLIKVSIDGGTWTTAASTTAPTATTGGIVSLQRQWDGGAARMQIWSKILSTGELTTLYNSGVGLRCQDITGSLLTSLLHCWDLSGNGLLPVADGVNGKRAPQFFMFNSTWPGTNTGAEAPAPQSFPDGGAILPSYTILNHPNAGTQGWFYEILNPGVGPSKNVVVGGDSLLNGLGTGSASTGSKNISISVSGQLQAMLGNGWHYDVQAYPGWTTTSVIANNSVENALCGETGWKGIRPYVIEIGRNDIDAAVAAATIEANIQSIVSSRKAAGCTVAVMTITPCTFGGVCNGTTEALKATINTWILGSAVSTAITPTGCNTASGACSQLIYTGGNTGADYVIDSGNETLMATASNTLYYLDGLHYTGEGSRIIARYIYALLATL